MVGDKILMVFEGGFVEHSSQTMWCGFGIRNSDFGIFAESMPTGGPGLSGELEIPPYPSTEIDDITTFKIACRIDLTTAAGSLSLNGEAEVSATGTPNTLSYMNLYGFQAVDALNKWVIEKVSFLVDTGQDLTELSV
jgi:hypothetical protein